ncbi:MAG: zf-HC2 domain-containing protein [Thiobacillus sp.]|nr:zf-HC2 domain-containing protein [Thiobacillus sp.]
MPTCKETTELASRAMDKRLPIGDRIAMRMHLAICKNCMRFTQQLQDMRRLLQTETTANDDMPGLTPEARQRIASELQNRLDA